MTICKVCGKVTDKPTWCSVECVDYAEGNSPRKPKGFDFDAESPDTIKDPGNSYMSNEEARVYGD